MTSTIPFTPKTAKSPSTTRVAIARFIDLRRADAATGQIVNRRVPDSAIQINAAGLRPGQAASSSENYWDAAMEGLRAGALFGVVFGALWSLAGLTDVGGLVAMILGALIGAAFGAVVGVVAHRGKSEQRRGEHLFEADEFHVLVDERYEQAARTALRGARGDAALSGQAGNGERDHGAHRDRRAA